jgi:hypothetical protein
MGKRERRRRRAGTARKPVLPPSRFWTPATVSHLAELVAARTAAERAVDLEIEHLVSLGVGWPAIAHALGVSRQAARQRALRRP